MKGAKRDMEIIFIVFLKEIFLYSMQIGHFGTKMVWCPLHFESALRFFINFTQKKRDQEVHEIFLVVFLRKTLFCGNLIFSSHFLMFHWVRLKLSQATVTIVSFKHQDMIKILKESGHALSGKRLCGR